jgi:hypothetical protein
MPPSASSTPSIVLVQGVSRVVMQWPQCPTTCSCCAYACVFATPGFIVFVRARRWLVQCAVLFSRGGSDVAHMDAARSLVCMRDFSLLFGACCVLTWCGPLCFVYALDCHRAARESCCDAVAAVPAAPLIRLCAWTTCPSLSPGPAAS